MSTRISFSVRLNARRASPSLDHLFSKPKPISSIAKIDLDSSPAAYPARRPPAGSSRTGLFWTMLPADAFRRVFVNLGGRSSLAGAGIASPGRSYEAVSRAKARWER